MKSKFIICGFAAALAFFPLLTLSSDVASAQSGGRKGKDVIQKCYGKDGRPHRCDQMNEKGEVKPEYKKKKG